MNLRLVFSLDSGRRGWDAKSEQMLLSSRVFADDFLHELPAGTPIIESAARSEAAEPSDRGLQIVGSLIESIFSRIRILARNTTIAFMPSSETSVCFRLAIPYFEYADGRTKGELSAQESNNVTVFSKTISLRNLSADLEPAELAEPAATTRVEDESIRRITVLKCASDKELKARIQYHQGYEITVVESPPISIAVSPSSMAHLFEWTTTIATTWDAVVPRGDRPSPKMDCPPGVIHVASDVSRISLDRDIRGTERTGLKSVVERPAIKFRMELPLIRASALLLFDDSDDVLYRPDVLHDFAKFTRPDQRFLSKIATRHMLCSMSFHGSLSVFECNRNDLSFACTSLSLLMSPAVANASEHIDLFVGPYVKLLELSLSDATLLHSNSSVLELCVQQSMNGYIYFVGIEHLC